MYKCIAYEKRGRVAVAAIDQTADNNRVNRAALAELTDAVGAAGEDRDIAAVVLTGRGAFFCTGGRMDGFPGGHTMDMRAFADAFVGLQQAVYRCPKPVLAAVNGDAVAGGFSIVESCDFAVAGEGCRFGLPELSRGNFPMLALAIMQKALPKKLVFELAYGCELIDARTALEWHLVNRVVPKEEVLDTAVAFAERLADYNPVALSLGRQAFYSMVDMPLASAVEYGKSTLITLLNTEDVQEADHAIREHRDPVYRGY